MRKKTIILGSIALFLVFGFSTLSFAETDVTDKIQPEKSRMRYDRRAGTNYLDVSLTNISADVLLSPIKVIIDSISSPDVTVANADGTTAAGKPYFEYGGIAPGETTALKKWVFNNSLRRRFSYDVVIFDATPLAILITGKAIAGLPVVGTINIKDSSNPAKTSFSAINADGSYTLDIDETWTSPFLMWAEGWVNNNHLRLLSSFDLEEGESAININTTPATTAIIESAIGMDASEIDPVAADIPDPGTVDAIRETVEDTLANLFAVIGIPPGFNLFESPIEEVGSSTDQLFDAVDFSVDDDDNIVVADATDETQQVVIDPDEPAGSVPDDMVDSIEQTNDALTQIRQLLTDYYELFGAANPPDQTTLEAELLPDLASGYLNSGYNAADFIAALVLSGAPQDSNTTFIGCSIFRPMETQYYGNIPVEEMPDSHEEGVWALATVNINGKVMNYITSFVNIGNNEWKWYGNRRPIRRADRGRPRARRILFPAGAVTYHSGLHFWHNDVGNLAWNMGITNLAIFNPAFAPETIDGVDTNCVKLERRAGGLDTRFRLSNVPYYWNNDGLYQLSKEPGDRLIDLDNLNSQETIEFVVVGLDDAGNPVKTWLYTIPQVPHTVSELVANSNTYFAQIEQDVVSFQPFDSNVPDNPDAFPGNGGFFSWIFPNNPELFPSWTQLGWDDVNWNWNELQIDNPAWYAPGDFYAFTSGIYQPGINAILPRTAEFIVTMRGPNLMHYQANKRYDPWSEDFLSIENGELVFDMTHSYQPENISNLLTTQLRIRDREVTRFQADVKLEDGSFTDAQPDNSWDVNACTRLELVFQPEEYYLQGLSTEYIQVNIRIRLEKDFRRWVDGYIWEANDVNWDTKWSRNTSNPEFTGNFPSGELIETSQNAVYHTIAIEHDKVNGQMILEFDGQASAINLSAIPGFNGDDFRYARIRTRVQEINEPGDAGSITVRVDDVEVNGQIYDNFDNGFGINNWYINSYE